MTYPKISIAAARVNAGFTQEDAADKLGISKRTLVQWEKGRIEPRLSDLLALSKLYNFPMDLFFLPEKFTESNLEED